MPLAVPRPPAYVATDLPTAADLSGSTNLADYLTEQLAARGEAILPPGTIDISAKLPFHRVMGGRIRAGGYASIPTFNTGSGFNNPASTDRYATIIRTSNASEPVFDLDACQGLTLSGFSIETDGVGILYRNTETGWPTNLCLFDRLAFHRRTSGATTGLAIQAGEAISDFNAADLEIHSCIFSGLDGLRVKHDQGVNYHFSGTNVFGYCENAIYLEAGGNIVADCLNGYGVKTWVRMIGAAGNNRNNLFHFIKSDRGAQAPPVICDMSETTGNPHAIFGCVAITANNSSDPTDYPGHHYAFLLPADHESRGCQIVTGSDVTNWRRPVGYSYTPTVADNPFDA